MIEPSQLTSGRSVSTAAAASMLRTRNISVTKPVAPRDEPTGAEAEAQARAAVADGVAAVVAVGGDGTAHAALQAVADEADLLFVDMGAEIGRLPADVAARLRAAGLMVETMSSPSAARSYNVTLAEGRRVACALVPV